MSVNIQAIVTATARGYGYQNHTAQITHVARLIASGRTVAAIADYLVVEGVPSSSARTIARQVTDAVVAAGVEDRRQAEAARQRAARTATPTATAATTPAFDKATASSVIRAFVTDGSPHLRSAGARGATPEQVTALLQIAGLEDVPAPEPEMPSAGVLNRALTFARQHGFRG